MTVTKTDIAPTPMVLITVLVTLDTQAMEYRVPVRDVYHKYTRVITAWL